MNDARGDDRGQLILIAGIGIAVAFVALALILNSLVFTQYLATKPTADGGDAIEYQHVVADGVRGLVSEANVRDYGAEASISVRGGVDTLATHLARHYGVYGTLANVTVVDIDHGTSIHQPTPRAFTNRANESNWILFENAAGVRGFRLNVTKVDASSVSNAFTINVTLERTGGPTTFAIYDPRGTTKFVLNDTTSSDADTVCKFQNTTITVSNRSLDAGSCTIEFQPRDYFAGKRITSVAIKNGDNATGKYVAVVNETNISDNDDFYETPDRSPYAVSAVYAATVNAAYVSPDVTYRTDIRVLPDAFGIVTAGDHADDEPDGSDTGDGGTDDIRYGVIPKSGGLVFTYRNDPGNLSTVSASSRVTRLPPTNATVIGPQKYDLTGDGYIDIPYVDDQGRLYITNQTERSMQLASNAYHTKSLLAVGTWNGTGPSVLYTGSNEEYVYRVRPGQTPERVFTDPDGYPITAVVGIGNIDGDAQDELVYVDGSEHLRYLNPGPGTKTDKMQSGELGQNNGIGVGAPIDLNGDGVERIPMVSTSSNQGNLYLINQNTKTQLPVSNIAAKSPVTTYNVDGDKELELIYLKSGGQLWYVDDVLGTPTAEQFPETSESAINASGQTGVA